MPKAPKSSDERRREEREPLTLKVEYEDASGLIQDYTQNISHGGTFVLTSRTLAMGTPVRLVLSFPGLLKPLPVTGVVRWVKEEPVEERGVGVEFDMAGSDAMERVHAIVDRIAQGDPELVARNLKVLIVEDNPHVAQLIRDGLIGGQKRGLDEPVSFQFTMATNGRDAIDLLHAERFDVLITDIYLPVLDGAHLISLVRADAALAGLPIVAVSAGGTSARDAAVKAGADFFLDKPMRLADILETMRRLMSSVGPH